MNSHSRENVDASAFEFELPNHDTGKRYHLQHKQGSDKVEKTFKERVVEDLRKLNNFQYQSLERKSAF